MVERDGREAHNVQKLYNVQKLHIGMETASRRNHQDLPTTFISFHTFNPIHSSLFLFNDKQ
jgi:hypothetical protein